MGGSGREPGLAFPAPVSRQPSRVAGETQCLPCRYTRCPTGGDHKLLEHATPAEMKELVQTCVEDMRLAPERLEVGITYPIPEPVVNELVTGACSKNIQGAPCWISAKGVVASCQREKTPLQEEKA